METKTRRVGMRATSTLAVAALFVTFGLASAASAQDAIDDMADLASEAAPDDAIAEGSLADGTVTMTGESAITEVDASDGSEVTVFGESGVPIEIGIPTPAAGADVALASTGEAVFGGTGSGIDVVVQGLDDGARILAVIHEEAPSDELEFEFADGVIPELRADGSVDLFAVSEGIWMGIGTVAAPWAVDASGEPVGTHYEVDGSTLVQVVDLDDPGIEYPVVADPKVQSDCGIATCTLRFDRATTKWLAAKPSEKELVAVIGCTITGVVGSVVGAAACAIIAAVILYHTAKAKEYYDQGKCYGYRWPVLSPSLGWAVAVTKNQYNCK